MSSNLLISLISEGLRITDAEREISKCLNDLNGFFKAKNQATFEYFKKNETAIYIDLIRLSEKLTPEQKIGWPIEDQIRQFICINFDLKHSQLYELISTTQFILNGSFESNKVRYRLIVQ
jgi:hypothetical protein